jgi:hypothetical protein
VSIMALARAHLAGEHAAEPVKGCGLCPACPACKGKGVVWRTDGAVGKVDCKPCGGTGSQKGTAR